MADTARVEPSVLIAEDDSELRDVLARGLREEGFTVDTVGSGGALLRRWQERRTDVLIIDVLRICNGSVSFCDEPSRVFLHRRTNAFTAAAERGEFRRIDIGNQFANKICVRIVT